MRFVACAALAVLACAQSFQAVCPQGTAARRRVFSGGAETEWCYREDGVRQGPRSEEHTSELQSRSDLVCRLLLEKKKTTKIHPPATTAEATAVVATAGENTT